MYDLGCITDKSENTNFRYRAKFDGHEYYELADALDTEMPWYDDADEKAYYYRLMGEPYYDTIDGYEAGLDGYTAYFLSLY